MAISVRLRWLSVIEDYGICSPTLGFLDSAFQLSCITFLSGSVQLCVSHTHCVTLHISAGKHRISRHRNPWCVRVLFPLLVREERRIKDKQKSRETLLSLVVKPSALSIRTFRLLFTKGVLYS